MPDLKLEDVIKRMELDMALEKSHGENFIMIDLEDSEFIISEIRKRDEALK